MKKSNGLSDGPLPLTLAVWVLALASSGVCANNLGENTVWQFNSQQDKVSKTTTLDQIQKQRAGYYEGLRPVYNYTTYIEKQYNCTVSASTLANTGSNSNAATNSSPGVTNAGSTSSSTDANSASNSLPQSGLTGVPTAGVGYSPSGSLVSNQSNTGSLGSGVSGSTTSAATGAVTTGPGTSTQALNSQQSNTGMLSTTVAGSTACVGPLN
jgi:hypothetical protein